MHEKIEKISGNTWWSPTLSFSPEIAATVIDKEEDKMDVGEGQQAEVKPDEKRKEKSAGAKSPEKKKPCIEAPVRAPVERLIKGGSKGPGSTLLVDCGGRGDCGWRSLAFSICMQSAKGAKTVDEVRAQVEVRGKSLRTQAVHFLLNVEVGWKQRWVPDANSTKETEAGEPAQNLADFESALARPLRWIDGYGLQAVACPKRVNIVVFQPSDEEDDEGWSRVAFISPDDPNYKRFPLIPVVLSKGHFFALLKPKAKSFAKEWLEAAADAGAKNRLWFTKGIDDDVIVVSQEADSFSQIFRGGGEAVENEQKDVNASVDAGMQLLVAAGFQTPLKSSKAQDELDSWLKPCSSQKSWSGDLMRTCSSAKSAVSFSWEDKAIDSWKCPICKEVLPKKSDGITKHIQRFHRTWVQERLAMQKKFGRSGKRAGVGPGLFYQPTPFVSVPEESRAENAAFVCPYCEKCLPVHVTVASHLRISKRAHLLNDCSKKHKKVDLVKYRWAANKKNPEKGRRKLIATSKRKTIAKAEKLGHVPVSFPFKPKWKVSNLNAAPALCWARKTCRVAYRNPDWRKKCSGSPKPWAPSVTWWSNARKHNNLNEIAKSLGLPEVELNALNEKLLENDKKRKRKQQLKPRAAKKAKQE